MTVTVKLVFAVSVPSFTVRVMLAEPAWFAAGVTVTVRLAPLPPKTTFAFGTSVGFDEVAESVRLATEVCASETVIGKAALDWLTVRV